MLRSHATINRGRSDADFLTRKNQTVFVHGPKPGRYRRVHVLHGLGTTLQSSVVRVQLARRIFNNIYYRYVPIVEYCTYLRLRRDMRVLVVL